MNTITAIRKHLLIAAIISVSMLPVHNTANAGSRADTLFTGEHGSLTLSPVQRGGITTLQIGHTFRGMAVIHLSLRATDTTGKVTLADVTVRGYNGQRLSDAACALPAGAGIEVLSATIQYDEYGEHYCLSAGGNRLSFTKDGKDYSYACRYELKTARLAAPALPENLPAPEGQPAGAALTIR